MSFRLRQAVGGSGRTAPAAQTSVLPHSEAGAPAYAGAAAKAEAAGR